MPIGDMLTYRMQGLCRSQEEGGEGRRRRKKEEEEGEKKKTELARWPQLPEMSL